MQGIMLHKIVVFSHDLDLEFYSKGPRMFQPPTLAHVT